MSANKRKIIYIGDFDMINHNVQSHLVRSNGRMMEDLGYNVYYIGVNRNSSSFEIGDGVVEENCYHVPNTLSIKGVFSYHKVKTKIISTLDTLNTNKDVFAVITYQCPTFSILLKHIVDWCHHNKAVYIVNSADIPVFNYTNWFRNVVMKWNWALLHKINKENADGIISVSRYIRDFYFKEGRPSIIIPPLLDADYRIKVFNKGNSSVNFVYAGTPFVVTNKKVPAEAMKDRLDVVIQLIWNVAQKGRVARLDILGFTKQDYLSGVPGHAQILDELGDNVIFHGRVNHESVLEYVSNADATINYRDYSVMNIAGFSTKIVESVSIGTPVIINDIGDTFLFVKDGVTGFSLGNDEDENTNRLVAIIDSLSEHRSDFKMNCIKMNPFKPSFFIKTLNNFLENYKN